MPWNGAGSYAAPAASFPESNGTTVDATRFNATINDIAAGVTASLAKNGENSATANLPMGGFKHTGVADGTVAGQYLAWGQASSMGVVNHSLGLVATPSITFNGDLNTGFWSPGADLLAGSVGGAEVFRLGAAGLLEPLGLVGTPSYSFTGDPNTGMWSPAADTVALSAGGTEVWRAIATAFHPGADATISLGLTAKRFTVGYMGTVSDGAVATNELVGSAGTVARYGAGSAWTQLLLYASNAARIRVGTTGDLTPEADATQGCGSATKRWLLSSAQTFADGAYATGGFIGSSGTTARIGYGSSWTDLALGPGGTDRLHVISDGRVYGSALHNNAGAVTGTANQYIASGTYTPTGVNVANAAITTKAAQWIRVGNVVTVSGEVDITPTANATLTRWTHTLPIAITGNFATTNLLGGTIAMQSATSVGAAGVVFANSGNATALFEFYNNFGTGVNGWYYTFTYLLQ